MGETVLIGSQKRNIRPQIFKVDNQMVLHVPILSGYGYLDKKMKRVGYTQHHFTRKIGEMKDFTLI